MRRRNAGWLVVGLSLPALAFCGAAGALGAPHAPTRSGRALASGRAQPVAVDRAGSTAPGAVPLGTTNYPVPAGAYFVAPAGKDTAAGTQAAPWATLGHAVATVPNHATIVMRAGIYRESVAVNGKALTIQPYPNEAVIERGSNVVNAFVKTANNWTLAGWTFEFPRQSSNAVTTAHPLANAPDQVFVDGSPLTQVAKTTAVTGRSFAVDYTAHKLVIGADPTGHTVEASTKMFGLRLERASGTVVRGIQFDEYATPVEIHGAVLDKSGGAVFENDFFLQNAMAGLSVQGPGTLVTHDTMADNGQLGLHAYQADHLHVTGCELRHNNTELFDYHQEAGGMKSASSDNVVVDNTLADANLAKGIWFDVASTNTTIVRNEAFANVNEGFQFEISSFAVIASNVGWRNGGAGVRVIESQHVDVYNNVMYQNNSGIDIWDGARAQNVADVVIRNNVVMDGLKTSTMMFDIDAFAPHFTGKQMGVSTDADAFCRTSPTLPPQIAAWASGPQGQLRYTSLPAFTKATGNDTHGIACDGAAAAKMLTNPSAGDFSLALGSRGFGAGVSLPSNVAQALAVSAGVPVDLGLLGPGVIIGHGPTITAQPLSQMVLVGQSFTMSAAASGQPKPTVQWQVATDGVTFVDIAGATATHYSGVAASTDDGKVFRAVFANSGGVSISDPATLTVGSTSVSLVDPGPVAWGQPLLLVADASVSGLPPESTVGSVTFYDGSDKLGVRPVRAGVASIGATKLDAGNHGFVAVYTVNRVTVTSAPLVVEIAPANTSVTVVANRATVAVGRPITLSARALVVAPSTGQVIAGTISFYDDGVLLQSVPVRASGRALFTTTELPAGAQSITATYDGDTNYAPSLESVPIIISVH